MPAESKRSSWPGTRSGTWVPSDPPVVAVSYSGEVGRTIEAAATADGSAADGGPHRSAGGPTGQSRSRRPILMSVPTLGFSPGTSTYVAMVTALLVLAAELARARGDAGERHGHGRRLGARARSSLVGTLARSEAPAAEAASV